MHRWCICNRYNPPSSTSKGRRKTRRYNLRLNKIYDINYIQSTENLFFSSNIFIMGERMVRFNQFQKLIMISGVVSSFKL